VMLAQMFLPRIVGLRAGEVVYDGPADGLTPEVLTRIYGEEDWSKTGPQEDAEDRHPATPMPRADEIAAEAP